MTAIAFINSVFLHAWADEGPEPMTEEEARTNIENWKADGVEVPEMITPSLLSTVWNLYCKSKGGNNMIPAIYVHETRATPYASAIAEGYKPIETRTHDVLGRFVGQKILIIRTRDGHPADVVGSAVIASKRFYTVKELDNMRNLTLIPPGSKYDCHGRGKWGYTMTNAVLFSSPIPLSAYTIERKTRSWAMLSA